MCGLWSRYEWHRRVEPLVRLAVRWQALGAVTRGWTPPDGAAAAGWAAPVATGMAPIGGGR